MQAIQSVLKNRVKTHSLRWVWKHTRKYTPALAGLVLCAMVQSYLGVRVALGTQRVIDAAVSGNADSLLHNALLLGGMLLVTMLLSLVSQHGHAKVEADMDRDLKKQMMHQILRGNYQALSVYHSGDLTHRLNDDISTVCGVVLNLPERKLFSRRQNALSERRQALWTWKTRSVSRNSPNSSALKIL